MGYRHAATLRQGFCQPLRLLPLPISLISLNMTNMCTRHHDASSWTKKRLPCVNASHRVGALGYLAKLSPLIPPQIHFAPVRVFDALQIPELGSCSLHTQCETRQYPAWNLRWLGGSAQFLPLATRAVSAIMPGWLGIHHR